MSHLNAIIVFNTDRFIALQSELINFHVGGDILIVDNSSDYSISKKLKDFADIHAISYLKTSINENDFSKSHAYAASIVLEMYRNDYDSIFLLDHDIFPFKEIDLPTEFYLAGVQQIRKSPKELETEIILNYLWPGCLFINTAALKGIEIDLHPQVVSEIFLDTGGGLYKLIKGNEDKIKYLAERHEEDYSIIDESWMHFRKGSNWANETGHQERIERLMEKLQEKL